MVVESTTTKTKTKFKIHLFGDRTRHAATHKLIFFGGHMHPHEKTSSGLEPFQNGGGGGVEK